MRVFLILLFWALVADFARASEFERTKIPDEYEAVGDHALALSNSGSAALTGISATRVNPALIATVRQYAVGVGYHWPTMGRGFYQVGIVDSKTSSIAAGVTYTGFQDEYRATTSRYFRPDIGSGHFDSPIKHRASLGFGKVFEKLALGVQVSYIQGVALLEPRTRSSVLEEIDGLTLGIGGAGLLTQDLRFGLSAENLNNKSVQYLAPTTWRAGVAYILFNGDVTVHLDLRDRERIEGFEQSLSSMFYGTAWVNKDSVRERSSSELKTVKGREQLMIGSFSARIYDMLRLIGSFGQSVAENDERRLGAIGLAMVHQQFSMSYNIARPYLSEPLNHTNINLDLNLSL